jgi:hypothetical protein
MEAAEKDTAGTWQPIGKEKERKMSVLLACSFYEVQIEPGSNLQLIEKRKRTYFSQNEDCKYEKEQ